MAQVFLPSQQVAAEHLLVTLMRHSEYAMFYQAQTIRILSLLIVFGLFSGLSGCSSWMSGDFKDPDVRLIKVDVVKLAEGESSSWFTVPAHGHHSFDVPVRTNLWRHLRQIVKALEKPDQPIPYRLQGKVKTGLMFGRSVHMSRNGEIIPGEYISE